MHDETEVGFVETHAERGRGYHGLDPVAQQVLLGLHPLGLVGLPGVRHDGQPGRAQVLGDLLGGRHRQAVDDAGAVETRRPAPPIVAVEAGEMARHFLPVDRVYRGRGKLHEEIAGARFRLRQLAYRCITRRAEPGHYQCTHYRFTIPWAASGPKFDRAPFPCHEMTMSAAAA